MNKIKRLFSCFSVLTVCLLANMGIEAKAVTSSPVTAIMQNKEVSAQNQQFTLHSASIQTEDTQKLAGHYSHSSHYSHGSHGSHHSHYSSRY